MEWPTWLESGLEPPNGIMALYKFRIIIIIIKVMVRVRVSCNGWLLHGTGCEV